MEPSPEKLIEPCTLTRLNDRSIEIQGGIDDALGRDAISSVLNAEVGFSISTAIS